MGKKIDILAGLGIPPLPSSSPDAVAALLWAREVCQNHLATSYSVNDPEGVDELKSIEIGGVDQWLHIRGRKRSNPVLLWLHGGPGGAVIGGGLDSTLRPWEDYFTIVLWDQRQTGKSYYPADDESSPLTISQFISDTEDVILYLRDYLKKEKIFLLGASWGTILGMSMVKSHPEWLHAYIGVGQVVKWLDSEKEICKRLLMHAKACEDNALINKITQIATQLDAQSPARERSVADNNDFTRRLLVDFAGEACMHHSSYDVASRIIAFDRLISPYLTLTDLSNSIIGDDLAAYRPPYTFLREALDFDLPEKLGSSFEVPIFFFTGTHDWQTPVSLSDQWFSEIKAPYKELVHFEESSHFVVNEEPGKFLVSLVNKVLPFAQSEADQSAHIKKQAQQHG